MVEKCGLRRLSSWAPGNKPKAASTPWEKGESRRQNERERDVVSTGLAMVRISWRFPGWSEGRRGRCYCWVQPVLLLLGSATLLLLGQAGAAAAGAGGAAVEDGARDLGLSIGDAKYCYRRRAEQVQIQQGHHNRSALDGQSIPVQAARRRTRGRT